jgi:DHA1 family multidrug resistance protein-like MFS transporter
MLGPLLGGLLGLAMGIHYIFVATGVILALAGVALLLKVQREGRVSGTAGRVSR